jgi:hypothetical protein
MDDSDSVGQSDLGFEEWCGFANRFGALDFANHYVGPFVRHVAEVESQLYPGRATFYTSAVSPFVRHVAAEIHSLVPVM